MTGQHAMIVTTIFCRLEYDNKTRTTHNPPGVDIQIPGWGTTDTVEYLDHSEISLST